MLHYPTPFFTGKRDVCPTVLVPSEASIYEREEVSALFEVDICAPQRNMARSSIPNNATVPQSAKDMAFDAILNELIEVWIFSGLQISIGKPYPKLL
jgi:hypothetical protein